MKAENLILELSKHIDQCLAKDLVREFVELQNDCKTGTLGKASGGKFIETVVQVLQFLEAKKYDKKPNVDEYLRILESKQTLFLNDDLKICCSRVARACYTLRNKRNILHKGAVDPNIYDLRFFFSGTQWILSELVRQIVNTNMSLAGKMIEFIQIPISSIVEELGDRKIVYGNLTVENELLVLLHSCFPEYLSIQNIQKSMDRRSESAIYNSLKKLWSNKLIHKEKTEYKLTQEGFKEAVNILSRIA